MKFKIGRTVSNRPMNLVLFKNKWMSFKEVANLKEHKHLNLTGAILNLRYKNGDTSEARFLRPKRNKKKHLKDKRRREDIWVYEGCTPEQIAALEEGTNRALLAV